MLSSKTVFIVGAGASKEVDMPVGSELRDIILRKLHMRFEFGNRFTGKGDQRIVQLLRSTFQNDANIYFTACATINAGLALAASIDDFIDLHRSDPAVAVCGKLAIATAILEREKTSKLYVDGSNIYNTIKFDAIEGTWYIEFFRLLTNRVAKEDLGTLFDSASIICFNYDRCIEQFLLHAIAAQYAIERDAAKEIVKKLRIYRPYGSVGDLFSGRQFGSEGVPSVDSAVTSLRTYTEQIEDEASLRAMKDAIDDAQTLVFLGSAFHANNMLLLQPTKRTPKRIFATRSGISDGDLVHVTSALNRLRKNQNPMQLDAGLYYAQKCHDLFDEYRLALRAKA